MLYGRREKFSKLSNSLGKFFRKICPSPNIWTVLGIVPAVISFYFLINQSFLISAFFFMVMAGIDFIDGSVARATKKVTILGAYLDTVIDRVTEFVIILGLFLNNYPDVFLPAKIWIFLLLFGSMMTTYVKASAFEKKMVNKELKGGILERGERLILIFLVIILSKYNPFYAAILISLTAIASNVTALQRFLIAIK